MTAPKIDLKTDPKQWNVGLIGYGEVGRILAEDLRKQEFTSPPMTSSFAAIRPAAHCATMRGNMASR